VDAGCELFFGSPDRKMMIEDHAPAAAD